MVSNGYWGELGEEVGWLGGWSWVVAVAIVPRLCGSWVLSDDLLSIVSGDCMEFFLCAWCGCVGLKDIPSIMNESLGIKQITWRTHLHNEVAFDVIFICWTAQSILVYHQGIKSCIFVYSTIFINITMLCFWYEEIIILIFSVQLTLETLRVYFIGVNYLSLKLRSIKYFFKQLK